MKKAKRLIGIILVAVMLFVTVQAAFIAGAADFGTLKVAAISDIRYQAGAADKEGLILSKSGAIFDEALKKVMASDADVLLVTGDLTNNGSKASHQYVAEKLAEVEKEGIDVYVIPGEHDVREGGVATAAISKAQFKEIYKDFGYDEKSQDTASASYLADLGKGFKVVMSDSVAENGQGQLPQWVADRARAEIDNGNTVFAASHHPAVTRGGVDRTFMDLLNTLYNTELYLDKYYRLYTDDPVAAAKNLGLVDRSCIIGGAGALADAGVKYIFTGHGGTMSISETSTTNGADMFDVMTGSLVNASAGVRFATLSKGVNNMKEQRAEFSADMITSAEGVENVEAAAHAALKRQMPAEVDYAINTAEKVIAYLIPALKPNIQQLVRDIDLAVLVPDMASLFNLLGGTISSVKNDLAAQYVGPLFDILGNSAKLHNIIVDLRSALEKMDFNGQDLYGFLTDVFIAIQKGDGKTPPSVEGFFAALRNQEPGMLVGVINSFADNFNPTNLVNLLNEVLDLQFHKKYIGTLQVNVHLRGLLAGPYALTSGLYTYNLDLWGILDGLATLPDGSTISSVARPLVNDLILGGPNDPNTKQTPQRFTANLKANAEGVINLLFKFGVGDLIGDNIFAQGQRGAFVAKTITFDEFSQGLDKLIPNNDVTALNPADWALVRDVLNASRRFSAEQLATTNDVLVAATDTAPAVTQLDKLKTLANAEFYKGVAADFTAKVNALPAADDLTLNNADTVFALRNEYDQFYQGIKNNVSADTKAKLDAAVAKMLALQNYDPAVDAVIAKIGAIGEVTVESEKAIKDARSAFDALSVRQKKQVSNYQVLLDAEAALQIAKDNAAVIAEAEAKINAIGEVAFTAQCKVKIDTARKFYDSLDEKVKANVTNYEVLTAAEARYAELKAEAEDKAAAKPVIDKINLIGTVTADSKRAIEDAEKAYDALTDSQKAFVTNYDVLVKARNAYNEIVANEAADKAAAEAVTNKISAIGTVTLEREGAVLEARNAYDALTDAQKKLVTNYPVLVSAEKALAGLKKQAADEAAARGVEALIDAIGEVTVEKEAQIQAARDAYNALTSDQKRLVKNLSVLASAEAQLSLLKNDFYFEDGATGISLRADSGVLPVDTVMTVQTITSGNVYDAVTANGFKAVRIYDIGLAAGGKDVTPTKAVKISIPMFAVNTAVYFVSESGEITPVTAALENGSFTFTAENAGMFAVAQTKVYADTAALEEAIARFEALNEADYAHADFAKAQAAYEAAQAEFDAHYELTAANQRRIDKAAAALNDAIDALRAAPADTSALTTALYDAKVLKAEDYKDFTAVDKAIAEAEEFLASDYDIKDQARADELAENLRKAVEALEKADADFSPINEALAKVPKDLQNYTAESVAALNAAVKAAEEAKATITRDDPQWEAKVQQYADAVLEAIAGLKKDGVTYADTELLEQAIYIVDLYNPDDYVDFSAVEEAVASAKALLESKPTADKQAEVDAAAAAIFDAVAALQWA